MRGFELENGYIDISPLKDGSIVLFRREGTSKRNWYGRIRLNNGKYQKFTTKTSDLKSAEKIVKRRYTEMYMLGDQIRSSGHRVTFAEAFGQWEAYCKGRTTVRGGSWEGTLDRVRRYALPYFKSRDLSSLSRADFEKFYVYRMENFKRVKPTEDSLIRERTSILAFLRYCYDFELIEKIPEIRKPKTVHKRRETFSDVEWRKIYTGAREFVKEGKSLGKERDRFYLQQYILILANSGLRVGEARGLKWRDIRLRQDADGKNYYELTVTGKTGLRNVVLSHTSSNVIERLLEYRSKQLGRDPKSTEHVFISNITGKAISSFRKGFDALLEYCQVPKELNGSNRTIYSLRHYYATKRLEDGLSPYLLAENMGTSVDMLERHYGHVRSFKVAAEINRSRRTSGKST
jgi:integrase